MLTKSREKMHRLCYPEKQDPKLQVEICNECALDQMQLALLMN